MFLRHTSRLDHETSLSDHHTRQSDHNPDQTTTSEYHTGPSSRPDHQIRPSDHNTTAYPDHQFRLPHQTTGYHPWRISFQSAQHTQPLEMIQVRCILYGLGRGWYIELWMNLAKHTFHTRSAWSFRIIFRLKLIVVRLVSEFPGLVRASPSLSLKMGSFAGVRSAIRFRLLAIGSAFWIWFGIWETAQLHLFAPFSDGLLHHRLCRCRRRSRRLHFNLPLSCAKFELIYHTSLDSLCAGQVKLSSARFNQIVIILRHNLVN